MTLNDTNFAARAAGAIRKIASLGLWVFAALLVFGALSARAAAPVLTVTNAVTVPENESYDLPFSVSDADSPVFSVTVTARSSDTNVIMNSRLVPSGAGANRTLQIRPNVNKFGSATITLVATDGAESSTNTIALTVPFVNQLPTFTTSISDKTIREDASATNFAFVIADFETAAASLTVSATSSNTTLVPNGSLVLAGTGANRTLTVTPAANLFGTTLIKVVVTDGNSGTATNQFLLTVLSVNDAPSYTLLTNRVVLAEDAGLTTISNFVSSISVGPSNESSQSNWLVLSFTTNLFAQVPAVDSNGTLTFQVATNGFGTNIVGVSLFDDGGTANSGVARYSNAVTFAVSAVNDAPVFTNTISDKTITEDAGRTNLTFAVTDVDNAVAGLVVLATSTNQALVPDTNLVFTGTGSSRTLGVTALTNANGTTEISVIVSDSAGGTATNKFVLTVSAVNDLPRLSTLSTRTVLEDSGATNIAFTVADPDTDLTNVTVTATVSPTNIVSLSVTNLDGTNRVIVATPLTNAFGNSTISVVTSDGSGSVTNSFLLTVTGVNDVPVFALSTNLLVVAEDAGLVRMTNFLTGIAPGPTNETGQTWTFTVSSTTNGFLYSTNPIIATNGLLTFRTASNASGSNLVTVVMTDSGGTANGGVSVLTNTFSIVVDPANDAPSITGATNRTLLEDATNGLTATITVADIDTDSTNFTLTATSANTNIARVSITATNVTASNAVFTLTFALPNEANGSTAISVVAGDGALNTTNSFLLTVTPVNDSPAFLPVTNIVSVAEDAGPVRWTNFLYDIASGPSNESAQTWTFTVTSTTNGFRYTTAPAIATNGLLTFQVATNLNGSNLVTVVMTDSGGTANGGINVLTNTFSIVVDPGNDAPLIAGATNRTILEDAITGLTASITVTDIDTDSTNFTLTASSADTNVATVSVTATNVTASNAVFTLTFAPKTNAFGSSLISVVANDGARNTTNTFTLTVTPVNDVPVFALSTNLVSSTEDAGAVRMTNFLTGIAPGPTNETGQTWAFAVSSTTNGFRYASVPAIATNGLLTFQVATNANGSNLVTVVMTDTGGTANSGVNVLTNTFSIVIDGGNDAPLIVGATNRTILEDAVTGLTASITVTDIDTDSTNFTLTATSGSTNVAGVSITATNVTASNAVFTLTFAPQTNANGSAAITVVANDGALNTTNSFLLTVTPVNDVPVFALSTNLVATTEDGGLVRMTNFLTGISSGPSNESAQTWTFALTSTTNGFTYATAPAITTNGLLTFQVATNSNGSNLVTVVMTDTGGTANSGVNVLTNTFSIVVGAGNDAPLIAGATNRTILEDAVTGLTASITITDIDTDSTNFTLTASSANTNLVGVSVTATNVTASNVVFTLTFAPQTNANGSTVISVVANDGALNTTNSFLLTVTPVNDVPAFALSTNLVASTEDAGLVRMTNFLTGIAPGPTNETGQTWTFAVTSTTNGFLYTTNPIIATNGLLTFRVAPNANGSNLVTVVMTDSGGTANSGVNVLTNTFSIVVSAGNDAPSIAGATNRTLLEDAVSGLTASITVTDIDTDSTNFTLTASSANTNLVGVSVTATNVTASNAVFTLTFAPQTNANGSTVISLVANDGALNTTNSFLLTVTPVNDLPAFTVSTNLVAVSEDAGFVRMTNFLTGIAPGPTNETGQTWTFAATSTTNGFGYASVPTIATNGLLTFQVATNASGSNLVTVVMTDSGGTANGGVNVLTNTFSIVVGAGNDAPLIAGATNRSILEDAVTGLTASITVTDLDSDPTNFVLSATSANTNVVAVSVTATNVTASNAVFTLTFAPQTNANGSAAITVVANDGALNTTNSFVLTVTPVNDVPVFALSTNLVSSSEDAGMVRMTNFLTGISPGPTNETGQTWAFTVSSTTNGFGYANVPAIATNGLLTFQVATNSNGSNLVTVVMTDTGGTANSGVNVLTNTFSIVVGAGNDAPLIAGATNRTILEDAVTGLTASITVTDIDTDSTNFTLTASSANTNLVGVSVTATNVTASNAVFTLTFAPQTNANGSTVISVVANDGALNTTNSFILTVTPVNDVPAFALSTNLVATTEDAGLVLMTNFLTGISSGPSNESAQTWTFAVSSTTNGFLYTTNPIIATNGLLTFRVAPNANGSNLVTVVMTDSGGTANSGVNVLTNTFSIVVGAGNDAPSIAGATNRTLLEDAVSGLTASITVTDIDTDSTNFTLTATSANTNLVGVSVTSTNVTASNAVFTLTFAPQTNANGSAAITVVANDGALSTTNTFTLTVTPVNDVPVFALSTNLVAVSEDAGAVRMTNFLTGITPGPTNETGQTWAFTVTSTTNGFAYSTAPAIATNGLLTFQVATNSNGSNLVTVVMTDTGGTANSGVNVLTNTFSIVIGAGNDAPLIAGATNRTILEDAVTGLTASITVTDIDTDSTNFTLTASSGSTNVAGVSITATNVSASNAVFTLTFAPQTNANGSAAITVVANDGALSTTNSFTLTVTPVNDVPVFALSTNLVAVAEDAGAVRMTNFLTGIAAGPANETNQTWTFTVTSTTNGFLYSTNPAIATNGLLTFQVATNANGSNLVTVVMTDTGGTANSGVNVLTNTFSIVVGAGNDAPLIAGATNRTILEDAVTGLTANITVTDIDTDSTNFTLTASSGSTNVAGVSITATNVSASNAVFTLTFAPQTNANGSAAITVVANDGALSTTNSFTLTVTPVNDVPLFTLSTNLVSLAEDAGPIRLTNFLTGIAAGPTNETGQTWTFTVTSTTNGFRYATNPAITTNGLLTFQVATNANGSNLVTVVMNDNGGAANGGASSTTNTFSIVIDAANDAPTIAGATNRTILEDAVTGLTASITVTDIDTDSTNFTLTASSGSTNVAGVSITATNVTASNAVFTLTFAPQTNANGSAAITVVAGDGALSTTNTFTLTVTPVNDVPLFTLSTNLVGITEDTGAVRMTNFLTGIEAGPANETNQTWSFTLTSTTNGFSYATAPAITTNGLLTFQVTTNASGSNLVTVVMTDNGGTANGGVNVLTNTFSIVVDAANDLPTITGLSTNITFREDMATNFSFTIGDVETAASNLTLTAVLGDSNLVSLAVNGTTSSRTLAFSPKTNAFGTGSLTLVLNDGTASITNSYNLTVLAVNDAPTFSLGLSSVTVDKFGVAVSLDNVATNGFVGATNESEQTISFTVSNSAPSLFIVQPAISTNGMLTFTPGSVGGSVTVTVWAVDSGGTTNGGVNTSVADTMTIVIPANPFPYLLGRFSGLFYETNAVAHDSSGYFSLVMANNGSFSGYILRAGASNQFGGQFGISNANAVVAVSNTTITLHMTVDTGNNWTESISGVASNASSWTSEMLGYLLVHSASFQTDLAGEYNIALAGFSNSANGPSGSSTLGLSLSNNGLVTLSGYLADDTAVNQRSHISRGGRYPLYVPAYGAGVNGSISGWLEFTGSGANAFTSSSEVAWIKKTGGSLYTAGFTNQSAVVGSLYDSSLTELLTLTSGEVVLSGGNLSTPITNTVTLSHSVITVDPAATNGLVLAVDRAGGEIRGSFVHNGATNLIYSVILQSTNQARGYFIGTGQVGNFILK